MAEKPKKNQPSTPDKVQERDLFESPRYATELIIPFIPKKVKTIWEPMCGSGRMERVLRDQSGSHVFGTDLKSGHNVFDYKKFPFKNRPDCLITNPAFSIKKKIWDLFVEIDKPFALLIPADYSGWIINAIRMQGAEKVIPERRIDYLTPNIVSRVNEGENGRYKTVDEIPPRLLAKYSTSQFHSMWMCYKFGIGRTETFVNLSNEDKLNIL